MPKIGPESQRNIRLFFLAIALTVVIGVVSSAVSPFHYVTAVLYGGILIAWLLTIKRRIIATRIRRLLMSGGIFILALFFLHVARIEVAEWSPLVSRYLWYAYYIPFTLVPLVFFSVAYFIGEKEHARVPRWLFLMSMFALILWLGIFTNELHHQAFYENAVPEVSVFSTYGPLYYMVLLWSVVLIVGALLILVNKCRHSGSRRLWFIPVSVELFAVALLLLYAVGGGAPRVFGQELYYLQEVHGILYIGLWEACIQIALIPSNTDYSQLFQLSDIDLTLLSVDGTPVVRSARDRSADSPGRRLVKKSHPVSGGAIVWVEDHTEIWRLNERLRETTEELLGENELIEEENRIKAETAGMEEMRRLYDKISVSVTPQLHAVGTLMSVINADTSREEVRRRLRLCTVYGAYVKRRANLLLLAEKETALSVGELALSIRESFEYLSLFGIVTELRQDGEVSVSSEVLLCIYELFEEIFEAVLRGEVAAKVLSARLTENTVRLESDAAELLPDSAPWQERFLAVASSLTTGISDDGAYLLIRLPKGRDAV